MSISHCGHWLGRFFARGDEGQPRFEYHRTTERMLGEISERFVEAVRKLEELQRQGDRNPNSTFWRAVRLGVIIAILGGALAPVAARASGYALDHWPEWMHSASVLSRTVWREASGYVLQGRGGK